MGRDSSGKHEYWIMETESQDKIKEAVAIRLKGEDCQYCGKCEGVYYVQNPQKTPGNNNRLCYGCWYYLKHFDPKEARRF